MFTQKIDLRNRNTMVDFLTKHFRYDTLNSWNGLTSFANNVKLHKLSIPRDLEDMAYDIVCSDVDRYDYDVMIDGLIKDFRNETGYTAGFNGRSGGYIVLYDCNKKSDGGYTTCVSSIGHTEPSDYEDFSMEELREEVRLVQRFDKLCDDIRREFIKMLKDTVFVEEDCLEKRTRRVALCAA